MRGTIRDAETKEALPYVTVTFEGLKLGTRTDINGNFLLESEQSPRKIRCSYVGYESKLIEIEPRQRNEFSEILLAESTSKLAEVTIRPKKYSKKNNPAVDLIAEVFRHKDENRKEGLDFYSFEKYEKTQLSLNNITDKYRRKWFFKPIRFIFQNVDTNQTTKKIALPIYLRERMLRLNYRKNPTGQKAILLGERQTGFTDGENSDLELDEEGASSFVNSLYPDIDIYSENLMLLQTQFVGPLSSIANTMYRFYIVDTVEVDGQKMADVFFAPRNNADLAFMGNMLVALDSTYAVMKVEMGVSKSINLNWVTDLRIEQEFARISDGTQSRLMLVKDLVVIDFNILKKSQGRSMLTRKTSVYRNFKINQPLPDSLFSGKELLVQDTGKIRRRPVEWWAARRTPELNRAENRIEWMVDSIKQVPIFRFLKGVGVLFGTGYQRVGKVDFGMIGTLISQNDVEGLRIRVGARTNRKFYKPLILEGYTAYGTRDGRWKYLAAATFSFNGERPNRFPNDQIRFEFQRDLRIPGLSLDYLSQDNFATSFQRAPNDRFLFNEAMRLEYKKEWQNNLGFTGILQRRLFSSAGSLAFQYGNLDDSLFTSDMVTTEAGLLVRYAPNQQFYQGPTYRYPIPSRFPVFTLSFKQGFKVPATKIGGVPIGDFSYQKLNFSIQKLFFVAPLGVSDWNFVAARTFGKVPYPLLEIHPANQTYIYDWYSYNLMNFMEFVSDKYASLTVHHDFKGFFFNKIPLLRRLQLREAGSFKMLFGGLDKSNLPTAENRLFYFPRDSEGNSITNSLGRKPYIEASVGVSNIFKILRVDYVWRPNYRDLPGVSSWGIRLVLRSGI